MDHLSRRLGTTLVIGLLIAGCAPTASQGPSGPIANASPSPAASVAPATAPAPTATPTTLLDPYDVTGVGWESEFVFMEPHGLGQIKGLIGGGPGFVMWSDEAGGRPGFLISASGTSWEQIDSTLTGRTVLALVAGPDGLVALVNHGGPTIERWVSPDGRTWSTAATTGLHGSPTALLATSAGYVAAAIDGGGCGLFVWMSTDGRTWTDAGPGAAGPSTCVGRSQPNIPAVDQLVAGSDGLLAVGTLAGGLSAIWGSTDGHSWHLGQAPASGRIVRVAASGTGYVAVGDDGRTPGGAAAWTSADGLTWTAAPSQASFAGATMTDVVALADGTLASVGSEQPATGGRRFVAWTSTDGLTWQRSPAPLCQNVDVCDASGSRSALLARDGVRLVAYDGSINIITSPRATAGLHPATLVLGFDAPPAGTWTSGSVDGYCVPAEGSDAPVGYGAAYPTHLVDAGAASGSSTYIPSLQLVVGSDGAVQVLVYDRGDDAGFTGEAVGPAPGGFVIGPDTIKVDPGSTALRGRVVFTNVPVDRSDPSLPKVPPVSGSLTWTCH